MKKGSGDCGRERQGASSEAKCLFFALKVCAAEKKFSAKSVDISGFVRYNETYIPTKIIRELNK